MKKTFAFLILAFCFIIASPSYAQSTYTGEYSIVRISKALLSARFEIEVDYGEGFTGYLKENREGKMRNKKFESIASVMNFMYQEGWESMPIPVFADISASDQASNTGISYWYLYFRKRK